MVDVYNLYIRVVNILTFICLFPECPDAVGCNEAMSMRWYGAVRGDRLSCKLHNKLLGVILAARRIMFCLAVGKHYNIQEGVKNISESPKRRFLFLATLDYLEIMFYNPRILNKYVQFIIPCVIKHFCLFLGLLPMGIYIAQVTYSDFATRMGESSAKSA